jgi:uroporphyrinogen-III decarboxylase
MLNIDFKEHNEETRKLWKDFKEGKHSRIPVFIYCSPRFLLLNPDMNKKKVTYKDYFENPDIMIENELEFQYWFKHNVIQDSELGVPEEGWGIEVDFQNVYESAWLGCPIKYFDDQVPDVEAILNDDNKNMLFDKGIPDPFAGLLKVNLEYYEYFKTKAKDFTFHGKPIKNVSPSGMGTDGPFTIAANLRGATELMLDILDDPDYVHQLMSFVTEATIIRLKAWWKFVGLPPTVENFAFADDSIANISVNQYKEFILPYHKKLIKELGGNGVNMIHLCGKSTHHFKTIQEELYVYEFDTGFPVDHGELRRTLGKEVRIWGGPNVQILRYGTPNDVYEETKKILTSGILDGGNFILRDGNNLAPLTPVENVEAMYKAGIEFGKVTSETFFKEKYALAEKIVPFYSR